MQISTNTVPDPSGGGGFLNSGFGIGSSLEIRYIIGASNFTRFKWVSLDFVFADSTNLVEFEPSVPVTQNFSL